MRHPSETHGVARRANAILLLDDGWNCAKVAEALYLDDDTVRTWFKRYQAGGLDEMKVFDWKGRSGDLSREQMAELSARLGERLMRDSGEVAAYIAARWGVVYGHSGCVALLHRLGFESSARKACRPGRMRPGRPPSSRDTTNCSTGWPPTRSSPSLMPCTRSTSPAPRMAGSARATRWRCGGHRGASASTSTRRSTWRISTALWSRPSGSMPPPPSRCSRSWRPAPPRQRPLSSRPCGPAVAGETRLPHHARLPARPCTPSQRHREVMGCHAPRSDPQQVPCELRPLRRRCLRFLPPTIAQRVENLARHHHRQLQDHIPQGFSGSGVSWV